MRIKRLSAEEQLIVDFNPDLVLLESTLSPSDISTNSIEEIAEKIGVGPLSPEDFSFLKAISDISQDEMLGDQAQETSLLVSDANATVHSSAESQQPVVLDRKLRSRARVDYRVLAPDYETDSASDVSGNKEKLLKEGSRGVARSMRLR